MNWNEFKITLCNISFIWPVQGFKSIKTRRFISEVTYCELFEHEIKSIQV